ncbi:sulfite exporter TauE/SafE family protein [Chitinophaga sedimenti]|uniref:sulfite exporter TauE/SafE family protein n=1 Tax=Chitinophaga sedimenti TaxID=2033606 RepID=UPI00200378BD|nr:sulfite exporter TauE/SafE family protein [Chitinophaga sedimenti]MCK7555606.1 sulfite exporter TauE/SafE family protein [Chitinophaga sedimenti]
MNELLILCPLLFAVAFLYSSVGHGGASGYLALMALFSVAPEVMKPTALLLNLFVSLTSFTFYYREQYFNKRLFIPLSIASVPMAFVGGMMAIHSEVYRKMLGVFLLVPIARFLFFRDIEVDRMARPQTIWLLLIGGAIGLLSGMLGIGGGVILSPVLLLLRWTDQKQAAAISALFIFVNSLSGLIGQVTRGIHFSPDMAIYVVVAFFGGLLGSYAGAIRFRQTTIKILLAGVLAVAAFKLFLPNLN